MTQQQGDITQNMITKMVNPLLKYFRGISDESSIMGLYGAEARLIQGLHNDNREGLEAAISGFRTILDTVNRGSPTDENAKPRNDATVLLDGAIKYCGQSGYHFEHNI